MQRPRLENSAEGTALGDKAEALFLARLFKAGSVNRIKGPAAPAA